MRQLSQTGFVRHVFVLREIEAIDALVVGELSGKIDEARVREGVSADVQHLERDIVSKEATQGRQACIVDLVEAQAQLLEGAILAEGCNKLWQPALSDEVLGQVEGRERCVRLQGLRKCNKAISSNLVA